MKVPNAIVVLSRTRRHALAPTTQEHAAEDRGKPLAVPATSSRISRIRRSVATSARRWWRRATRARRFQRTARVRNLFSILNWQKSTDLSWISGSRGQEKQKTHLRTSGIMAWKER